MLPNSGLIMPASRAAKELDSPSLVRRWRSLVNDNITMGRDAHLIKLALEQYTPVQILYGMYQVRGSHTISIPQFLRRPTEWLQEDEFICAVELARCITGATPKEYWVYKDCENEETTREHQLFREARTILIEWADRILSG